MPKRVRGSSQPLWASLLPAVGVVGLSAGWGCAGGPPTALDTPRPAALPETRLAAPAPTAVRPQAPAAAVVTPTAANVPAEPAATAAAPAGDPSEEILVRPLARVNNRPIYESELRDASAQALVGIQEPERSRRYQEIRAAELVKLIERELVLLELEERLKKAPAHVKDKLKDEAAKEFERRFKDYRRRLPPMSDDQFKQLLEAQQVSLAGMKRQIERNYMMMEYVRNKVFPVIQKINLSDIREYYEKHRNEFRVEDAVKWQDIFINANNFPNFEAARAAAEKVRQEAAGGADFAALCKQHDQGDSRFRDGFGYGEVFGEIKPAAAEEVVFSLKKGEVGPLVEMGSGFHVVKVVDRVYAGVRPFDERVQLEVRKRLQNVVADREMKKMLDDLKRRAAIQVLADDVQ